jgi:hypothetical protein
MLAIHSMAVTSNFLCSSKISSNNNNTTEVITYPISIKIKTCNNSSIITTISNSHLYNSSNKLCSKCKWLLLWYSRNSNSKYLWYRENKAAQMQIIKSALHLNKAWIPLVCSQSHRIWCTSNHPNNSKVPSTMDNRRI